MYPQDTCPKCGGYLRKYTPSWHQKSEAEKLINPKYCNDCFSMFEVDVSVTFKHVVDESKDLRCDAQEISRGAY